MDAMFKSRLATFVSMLVLTAALHAQTTCPPLPEGAACDHYHYHLSVWNIETHTYDEVAVTRPFVSVAACEKARADAMRENARLSEFIKTTKIDTSMVANRFGSCHCDRTWDQSSPAFLNAKQRIAQLRAQQEAAWSLRERLLGQNVPGVGDRLTSVFGRPPVADRFLRETMPPRLPAAAPAQVPVTLLDSTIGSSTAPPAFAASLSLVAVSAPPASPPVQTPAAEPKTPTPIPEVQPANPPASPPAAEPHPPANARNR
jgi:hypothetical protein